MDLFKGRQRQLEDLKERFQKSIVVDVHGIRGVGKTALVREFCKRITWKVIWVDLRNIKNTDEMTQAIMRQISSDNSLAEETEEDKLIHLLENIALEDKENDLLVVFDDADDVLSQSAIALDLLISLSHLQNTKILLTSSVNMTTLFPEVLSFDELFVGPLSLLEGKELLRSICPSIKDEERIEKIVQLCGGIPLGILVAGGELADEKNAIGVDDIICLLSDAKLRLKFLSLDSYTVEEQIGPVLKRSLESLSKVSKELEDNLAMINYIPGSFDENEAVEVVGGPEEESKRALSILCYRNLVSQDLHLKRFNIHDLLRECINEYIMIKDIPGVRARFSKTFANILKKIQEKTYTKDYADALCRLNLEQQNFNKLFTEVIYCTEDTYYVFVDLAATSIPNGNMMFTTMTTYDIGIKFYEECLKKTQEFKNDIDTSKVLTGYGKVLNNIKGDYLHAGKIFRRAIEIRSRHPEIRDQFLAILCQSYGWNLMSEGKHKDATGHLEMAFEIEQELGLRFEPLILETMQSLAICYNQSEKVWKGEPLQLEVLKRRLHSLGTEMHPIIGSVMNNMGIMYQRKGENQKALEYYRKGLLIKTETKASVKAIVISEVNVAQTLLDCKQPREALEMLDNSLKRFKNIPSLYNDKMSLIWSAKGKVYMRTQNHKEAYLAFKKAIRLRKESSVNDISILKTICFYAEVAIALNKLQEAIKEINWGLQLKEDLLRNNPTIVWIIRGYELLMDAYFESRSKVDVMRTFEAGVRELQRLINVYEDLRDFPRREEMEQHLRKFRATYKSMMAKLKTKITEELCLIDDVVLYCLYIVKLLCALNFIYCIKTK
ncbi:uncharacterized protein LOC133184984 [Saccostrea echinata]|uniref:uncharacterized protein LOC133184984 n=1 Tax=Saccostrea echinata TaxID=191078 RepID=UPI002A801857|nr:uncharacterized protein LOC133184984 [Saccostrea echinata]